MARRTVTGQLNMFDFFSSMDETVNGEVEMVSLVPNFDEEPEVVDKPEVVEEPEVVDEPEVVEVSEVVAGPQVETKVKKEKKASEQEVSVEKEMAPITRLSDEKVAMSRTYEVDGETLEIAYINYNKVRITKGNNIPEIKVFETSKEAVDYYVEKMQELESED